MDVAMLPGFVVRRSVIDETERFLRERGERGLEAMALWAGRGGPKIPVISRVIVPEQVAVSDEWGCSVDLTEHAHFTLPDLLNPGELFFARVHSHPAQAYHSGRDDANEVISHQGAISIVVPDFCRDGIVLPRCAVYCLLHGVGWVEIPSYAVRRLFEVVDE